MRYPRNLLGKTTFKFLTEEEKYVWLSTRVHLVFVCERNCQFYLRSKGNSANFPCSKRKPATNSSTFWEFWLVLSNFDTPDQTSSILCTAPYHQPCRTCMQRRHAVGEVRQFCKLQDEGQSLMRASMTQLNLSARLSPILKLARTIANLADSEELQSAHLGEVL